MQIISFNGVLLKRLIKETGLTNEQFAQKIGISKHTLSKIENGKTTPSLPLAYIIAKQFGLNINDFIKED